MVPGDRLRRPWVALCLLALAAGCATQRVDPGEDDAATAEDQGVPKKEDVGEAPPEDAGLPPEDTGNEPVDTGNEPADTGNEPLDSGNGPVDTGIGPVDTGNGPGRHRRRAAAGLRGVPDGLQQLRGAVPRAVARPGQLWCLRPRLCHGAAVPPRRLPVPLQHHAVQRGLHRHPHRRRQLRRLRACLRDRAAVYGRHLSRGVRRGADALRQHLRQHADRRGQLRGVRYHVPQRRGVHHRAMHWWQCRRHDVSGGVAQHHGVSAWPTTTSTTGDDRGAIAVSDTQVFYTGDTATGRFDPDTLMGSTRRGDRTTAIVLQPAQRASCLRLAVGDPAASRPSGGRVDGILELNRTTGARTSTRIAISPPITIPSLVGGSLGFFSGLDRVVVLVGGRAININLTNGGATDLGAIAFPTTAQMCEVGALWGVAEFFNNALHVAFVQRAVSGTATIARMRLPDGMITPLAQFTNLSDMCAFSVSPARRRWYFHHESSSQFGGTAGTIGYCDAVMVGTTPPCPTGLSLCGSFCRNTQNDGQNCGGCGMGCPSDRTCTNGACAAPCPTGQGLCGGVCTDLQSNNANCGACGRTCISGQFCAAGNCIGGPRYTRSNSMEPFVQACSTAGNTRVLPEQR
jgi:hypothetical protein